MKAYELLSDASKWTQGTYARDKSGLSINEYSRDAVCWCIRGAVKVCYCNNVRYEKYMQIAHAIILDGTWKDMVVWQDAPERTFEEVRELLVRLDI